MKISNPLRYKKSISNGMGKSIHGFTLLEIALVLAIMGVMALFAIGIARSIQNGGKVAETRNRMETIATKAKSYYRSHGTLPGDNTFDAASTIDTINKKVPVGQSDLNMEQKYRLDAWGQYLYYFRDHNRQNITYDCGPGGGISLSCMLRIDRHSKTLIQGLDVNGGKFAGVIISGGPNQVIEPGTIENGTADFYTYGKFITYHSSGDDIIIPIDVTEEAVDIAIQDLVILQDKVNAFDRLFASVDNNNTGNVLDESDHELGECSGGGPAPCDPDSWPTCTCPPSSGSGQQYTDPRNGTTILDHIMANTYRDTPPCGSFNLTGLRPSWNIVETFKYSPGRPETRDETSRAFIYCFYNIPDNHIVDPWLRGYLWGCGNDVCSNINGNDRQYFQNDPRYHHFFSAGPDGVADPQIPQIPSSPPVLIKDDIVPFN